MSGKLKFAPIRREKFISIAIPSSLVKDTPHLREKVSKIGLIGRIASIYKIEEIIIYLDKFYSEQFKEARLISLILEYMEMPQYLRKYTFKIMPQLKFVGILPPLRTPNHLVTNKIEDLRPGDIREGIVINSDRKISLVNIGFKKLAKVKYYLKEGSRVTIRIKSVKKEIWANPVTKEEISIYWGYRVIFPKTSLGDIIRRMKYDVVIATSKHGRNVNECINELNDKWEKAKSILIIFGSPAHGVDEHLLKENIITDDVTNLKINMILDQGVETVRTEEAVNASLSILNLVD
jgi:predicted SPOUT superfamily RNA methylase MTH1